MSLNACDARSLWRVLAREGPCSASGQIDMANHRVLVITRIDAGHRDTAQGRQCGHAERDDEHEEQPVPRLDDPHAAKV